MLFAPKPCAEAIVATVAAHAGTRVGVRTIAVFPALAFLFRSAIVDHGRRNIIRVRRLRLIHAEVRTRQVQVAERVARVPALEVVLRASEMELLVLVHRSFFFPFFSF